MSCNEPTITPRGREGIGVIQPQSGLDYPLVAPSADIRYLIADFYLAYDDPGFYRASAAIRQHPLRIKWLYGVGCAASAAPVWAPTPVHEADILVVDAQNNTVFDSTQLVPAGGDPEYRRFLKRSWGDDYDIYEWFGTDAVCRMVVYKTWPAAFEIAPKDWPVHLAPDNATLDERAVYKMPRRLRSLKVLANNFQLGAVRHTGVIFAPGNNMNIEVTASAPVGLRQNTDIQFSAQPGAGTGKYDDCPDESSRPVFRLNGAAANEHGDLVISGPECIWIRQPTTLNDAGRAVPVRPNDTAALMIGSNCPPCCDCPDYENTAQYMNRVRDRYKGVGGRAHEVKLLHERNIARWIASRDCRLSKPLKLIIVPQCCPNMDVVLMYCNQTERCQEHIRLDFNLSIQPADRGATAQLRCGYSQLFAPGFSGKQYPLQWSGTGLTVDLPPIDIGNSAYVKFRLFFWPPTYPYSVTGTLTATTNKQGTQPLTLPNSVEPVVARVTETLNCNLDGTDLNCAESE